MSLWSASLAPARASVSQDETLGLVVPEDVVGLVDRSSCVLMASMPSLAGTRCDTERGREASRSRGKIQVSVTLVCTR